MGSGGICFPQCPVLNLQKGANTTYTFPLAPVYCPDINQDFSGVWCADFPFLDVSRNLSLLYDGQSVCGQTVTSLMSVHNSSDGQLSVEVSNGSLVHQCYEAVEDVLLLKLPYLLWDLREVGGENGAECPELNPWLVCDDYLVNELLVWGGVGKARGSGGVASYNSSICCILIYLICLN